MKIYPSRGDIKNVSNINFNTDIPLAYIDPNVYNYEYINSYNSDYTDKSKKVIYPYKEFDFNTLCLFDENDNLLSKDIIEKNFIYNNGKWIYKPYNSLSFTPTTFEYSIIYHRNDFYSLDKIYNFNIKCSDNNIATYFMSLCGDSIERGICPQNITINNKDLSIDKLLNNNDRLDFDIHLFKNLDADINTNKSVNETFNELAVNNTNLIAIMDMSYAINDYAISTTIDDDDQSVTINFDDERVVPYTSNKVELRKSSTVKKYYFNNARFCTPFSFASQYYFTRPNDTDEITYSTAMFSNKDKSPVLIEKRKNKGYIIYMTKDFIEHCTEELNSKIIYYTLSYVFGNSYLTSKTQTEWITANKPDYIINNGELEKKKKWFSSTSISNLVNDDYHYLVSKILIDKDKYPFVLAHGITNDHILFKVNPDYNFSDPIKKPDDYISVYTDRNNIIMYKDNIYEINDNIEDKVKINIIDNKLNINIEPYKCSSKNIYVMNETKFEDIILKEPCTYYIVCKPNETVSYFSLYKSTEYIEANGNILVTIEIRRKKVANTIYDMRQRGGGLPETYKDNYNCFDIGNINGRPYRKGNTLIITLPKYLEQYKDIIMDTVKQYCIAEDYPILLFE
ncbi:MAG: hypothetical protein SPI06_07225 [Terrisporobacter sp.]|uniref:hypothetical protein n=1 Tax=Terrisporobacter sp. TaxID=1965305 RepID=UPI002A91B10C|nr:hypothetical protein [Terrisporobacter sp.]MDY6153186.1 hypothetical protein [Terrisporobacter sp.]